MIGWRKQVPPEPFDVAADEVAVALEGELPDWSPGERSGHVAAVVAMADALGVPVGEDFRGRWTRLSTAGARAVFEHIRDAQISAEERRHAELMAQREAYRAELLSPVLPARELLRLGVGAAIAKGNVDGPPMVYAYGPGESEVPPDGPAAERVAAIAAGRVEAWQR